MRIFAGVPRGGEVTQVTTVGLSTTARFGNFGGYFFRSVRVKASIMPDCNWLRNEWPRMTLSGYFTSNSVFMPTLQTQRVQLSKIIAWKVINSVNNVGQRI